MAVSWRSGIGWRSRSVLCIRRLHPNGRSHDGHASDSDQSALHDLPPFEEQHAEKCCDQPTNAVAALGSKGWLLTGRPDTIPRHTSGKARIARGTFTENVVLS